MAKARTTIKPVKVVKTTYENKKVTILELDSNEVDAILFYTTQAALSFPGQGISEYRDRIEAGTLSEGSLAASIVRVVDALYGIKPKA